MGPFKELDPDTIRTLLEGQQDVLSSEAKKEEAVFRNTTCPACAGTSHEVRLNTRRPFSPGCALPNKLLLCLGCRSEFDPYTRLITRAGTTSG